MARRTAPHQRRHLPEAAHLPASPAPPAAKAVQVIAEVLAVLYAEAALLVQLQALLRTNMFLAKYR